MRRSIIVLALLCIAITTARLAFLNDIPEWDQSTYFLIGDAIVHGKHLYADIWDMKPPAIFATYAIGCVMTGSSFVWSGYLLSVFSAIGTMIAVFFAGAKLNRSAGLLAAGLFATVAITPALFTPAVNTESFIDLFIALAFAIWLWRGGRIGGAILAGVMLATSTLYKQVALVPAIGLALANLFAPRSNVSRRDAVKSSIALLVPIPLAWLAVYGYFAATGRASIFYITNFVYSRYYAGSVVVNLLHGFSSDPIFSGPMRELMPLVLLAMLGIILMVFIKLREGRLSVGSFDRAALIALLAMTFIEIAMPGQKFAHYDQLWLVPMSIAGAWGAMLLLAQVDQNRLRRLIAFGIALAPIGLLALQMHWYFATPRQRAAMQSPASFFLNTVDEGYKIKSLLHRDESMYVWCDEAYLYVIAGKKPPAAGLWKLHTVLGPVASWLSAKTVEDLDAHPPDLVVLWAAYPGPEENPIYQWIAARYDEIPGNPGRLPLMLLARRGSALHARAIAQPAAHDK